MAETRDGAIGEEKPLRTLPLSLAAAGAGGAAVWIAFWLFESILPQVFGSIPLVASSTTMLLAMLLAGAVLARKGFIVEAAALFAGSGASWALHVVHPLGICQSDLLYRPCTSIEIASMVIPVIVLMVAAVGLLVSAVAWTRRAR